MKITPHLAIARTPLGTERNEFYGSVIVQLDVVHCIFPNTGSLAQRKVGWRRNCFHLQFCVEADFTWPIFVAVGTATQNALALIGGRICVV